VLDFDFATVVEFCHLRMENYDSNVYVATNCRVLCSRITDHNETRLGGTNINQN